MATARQLPFRIANTFTRSITRRSISTTQCIRNDKLSPSTPSSQSPRYTSLADAPEQNVLRILSDMLTDAPIVGGRVTKPQKSQSQTSSSSNPSDGFQPASMSQMTFAPPPASSSNRPVPPIPSRQYLSQPEGYFYIHVFAMTRNTHITICDHNHNPVVVKSAGNIGLKKSRRRGPEAAFSTTISAFEKFFEKGYDPKQIELVFKGFEKARMGFMNALNSQQGERIREKVVRITDDTPLQIGRITAPNRKRR